MFISNPFAELSASVPSTVMQTYVVVMVRRNSAPSAKSSTTKLLSSAGESASMSGGGDIPPSSQKTANSGIPASLHESIRRTHRPTQARASPGLLPLLLFLVEES